MVAARSDSSPEVSPSERRALTIRVLTSERVPRFRVERNASVGHSAQLEGCVVEQGALVGMGATMLQRSRLGAGSMLAAGAVLEEGVAIPSGHMAAGVPATVKKSLDGSSNHWVGTTAQHYKDRAVRYRAGLKPIVVPGVPAKSRRSL